MERFADDKIMRIYILGYNSKLSQIKVSTYQIKIFRMTQIASSHREEITTTSRFACLLKFSCWLA